MLINRQDLEDRLAESGCCHRCLERCGPFLDFACGEITEEAEEDSSGKLHEVAEVDGTSSELPHAVSKDELQSLSFDKLNGVSETPGSVSHNPFGQINKEAYFPEKSNGVLHDSNAKTRAACDSNVKTNGNSSQQPCFVCLDLLSQHKLQDLIRFIEGQIKLANYESPHFVLSLVTVQILEIRQMLLALWLREKFPELPLMGFMERCLPIKQLLKDDLCTHLPEA